MAESSASAWMPRSAWAGLATRGAFGASGAPGLVVSPREGLGLASLIAAPGGEAALGALAAERFGAALPARPGFASGRDCLLVWSGPGQWLVVHESRAALRATAPALTEACAYSDQSDSRGVVRLSGPRVREVLAKGVPVDFDPAVFGPGDAAATLVGHVGVQLWQRDDAPTFELAVARSLAGTLWSWLKASAAEYGALVEA